MKRIIDISEENYNHLCFLHEDDILKIIENSIPLNEVETDDKEYIDKKGFLDKLRYMGYMDDKDEETEIEDVADRFTIPVKLKITEIKKHQSDFSDLNEVESEDCISRKQAIDGLGEQPYSWTDSDYEIQELNDWKNTKKMLENLPTVYPKNDDLIKANIQLKKQIEMLKLDRDCEAEDCISMKVLNEAIDHVEDFVCNHEKNTYRAQGMCEALTMIEEYVKEHNYELH